MATALIRFYAGLNAFLPRERRRKDWAYSFDDVVTVKHAVESLGVPHTEIELILANGRSVGFDYRLGDEDLISVYPPFLVLNVDELMQLRPPRPRPSRFLADNHLGRLVRYLRLLGVDTAYSNALDDPQLAQLAHDENRVLLTRDRGLLKRKLVSHGYCVLPDHPREQLKAVLERFDLYGELAPWSRCLRCNGVLRPVEKAAVVERLEPKTRLYFDEFHQCDACGQVYWQGSHYGELAQLVEEVRQKVTTSPLSLTQAVQPVEPER